ncbi:MAG: type IV toxin-antitoxin system AbiEi family antitoxin domain-containing protein, partial [Oscillospiraceae bacterium]|nr:type IV toxin-antitoxin system AbiEi family antitoxin domain-containing protein [Oscillospiraceae bacterium]
KDCGDEMNSFENVSYVMEQHRGYLSSKDARSFGIDNKTLQRMASSGKIERVAHGLYVDSEVFPDPFFVAQYRCPKGVFSHETALFLHDLSDRNPLRLMMTIPSGWNSKLLSDKNMMFFYSEPERMNLGISEVETPSGAMVIAYDIERTLCDCLRSIEKLDRDLVITAIKQYVRRNIRDNAKLLEYATVFKVRDVVYRYLEVLA